MWKRNERKLILLQVIDEIVIEHWMHGFLINQFQVEFLWILILLYSPCEIINSYKFTSFFDGWTAYVYVFMWTLKVQNANNSISMYNIQSVTLVVKFNGRNGFPLNSCVFLLVFKTWICRNIHGLPMIFQVYLNYR